MSQLNATLTDLKYLFFFLFFFRTFQHNSNRVPRHNSSLLGHTSGQTVCSDEMVGALLFFFLRLNSSGHKNVFFFIHPLTEIVTTAVSEGGGARRGRIIIFHTVSSHSFPSNEGKTNYKTVFGR